MSETKSKYFKEEQAINTLETVPNVNIERRPDPTAPTWVWHIMLEIKSTHEKQLKQFI